jgi:putative transposase
MDQHIGGKPSRIEQALNRKECCDSVVSALNQHLTIRIQGKLTQKEIFQSLVGMAVSNQSIHSISSTLASSPCETSFRYHLNKLDITELERLNSQILAHSVRPVLQVGRPYQFAIDFTHDPYYGKISEENEGYTIRNRLKKFTNDFYSYVTLNIITKDRQLTLAVFPIIQGISKISYIARC